MSFADYGMSISFKLWKNEHRNEIVSQENTDDRQSNPTALASSIAWHMRHAPGTSDGTPICCYHEESHKLRKKSQV